MALKTICAIIFVALIGLIPMGCGSGGTTTTQQAVDQNLVSISLMPANPSIANESDAQFTVTGIYADNSTADITSSVTWTLSDPTIAVIDAASQAAPLSGNQHYIRFRGKHVGKTSICASVGNATATTVLTVTPATLQSIAVSPIVQTLAKGSTLQFTATGTYSDNSTQDLTAAVTWASSFSAVASISNTAGSQGLATSSASGVTTVTATAQGISGSATLTVTPATLVSLDVTPHTKSIGRGTSQLFNATGTYSDNTTQDLTTVVAWSSSSTAIATISDVAGSKGHAVSVAVGSTTISATTGGISGSTTLTVTPAVLVSIAVTPSSQSIAKGTNKQFAATGTYSDNSTQDLTASATWSSSNTSVAAISNAAGSKGLTSTSAVGSVTITATTGGISGSTTLTVSAATLASIAVSPAGRSIAMGTTQQFAATGTYSDSSTQDLTTAATWSSSNATVANISNAAGSKGLSHALATGSATISATMAGVSGSTTLTVTAATLASLAVSPGSATIATGATQSFIATGTYSDSSTQNLTNSATWSSSNSSMAAVSNAAGSKGLATGIASGSVTITAAVGPISGTAVLTVATSGKATLSWSATTTYTDGTPATDLAGYEVYYGTAPGVYTNKVDVGNTTSYTISGLASGTYYFAVTAYNTARGESGYSNQISTTF